MTRESRKLSPASCQSCLYYRQQEKGCGTCHRFPPGFAGDASPRESHHWKFPVVHEHCWCGEFQYSLRPAEVTAA